jgi:RNase P protein component
MKRRDADLKNVMAEESSRGRRRPVRAVDLEVRRQLRRVMQLLADRNCDKRTFMAVVREEFGHQDGSPMFSKFVQAWDDYRGNQ